MARTSCALVLALLLAAGAARGAPIRYSFDGIASGSVDSTFFGTTFEITAVADPAAVSTTQPNIYTTVHALEATAEITISGIGSGSFLVPTMISSIQSTVSGPRLLFNADLGGSGIFQSLFSVVDLGLAGYQLGAPIGPIFQGAPTTQTNNVPTSLGLLTFSYMNQVSFSATAVPEPSTAGLVGVGLVLLAAVRTKRRRRR